MSDFHREPEYLPRPIKPTVVVCGVATHVGRIPGIPGPPLVCFQIVDPSHEWKHVHNTILRRTGLALAVALLATPLVSSPVSATPGLFGSQDATYDGVFRQSLVITGLKAHRLAVPATAVAWLQQQQCADGGFESFRADTTVPCAPGDPTTYSGEDTNATAAAAIALAALGDKQRARAAVTYLRAAQNADGGFPYYKGGASDANSTAMVALALTANGVRPASVRTGELTTIDFLLTATVGCEAEAATRGGVAYMPGRPNLVSDMATVQVLAALATRLPWERTFARTAKSLVVPALNCPGSIGDEVPALRDQVAGYTARQLAGHAGLIPDPWSGGNDLASTAWAVMGLAGANRARAQATAAERALQAQAATWVVDAQGKPVAGRLGLLLLLTAARGSDARAFGGVDLVRTAQSALSTS